MPRMPDNPADDLTKFDRQRRNLTISWAVLFFYQTIQPHFDRITVAGAQLALELGQSERIVFWLWGLLTYFLVRYNQYFNKAIRPLIGQDIATNFAIQAENAAKKEAVKIIRREYPELAGKTVWGETAFLNTVGKSRIYELKRVYWKDDETSTQASNKEIPGQKISLGEEQLWWFRQMARVQVSWRLPSFTEYWLPFLLPWISIAYGVCDNWSFLKAWIFN